MKRSVLIAMIAILSLVLFAGCSQNTDDEIAGLFQPIIGTWSANTLGIDTTLVFSADGSTTKTTTLLGVGTTKNGTWKSSSATITRTWSADSIEIDYYTFSDSNDNMTLSASPDGVATVYERQ